jgi:hypothetical protein
MQCFDVKVPKQSASGQGGFDHECQNKRRSQQNKSNMFLRDTYPQFANYGDIVHRAFFHRRCCHVSRELLRFW